MLSRAAFQFGVKMSDGRKSKRQKEREREKQDKKSEKRREQKLNNKLHQVTQIMKKYSKGSSSHERGFLSNALLQGKRLRCIENNF